MRSGCIHGTNIDAPGARQQSSTARNLTIILNKTASSSRSIVEKVINPSCGLVADAGNLAQIGDRGALDRLEGAEMAQQGAFAGRADAGDLLQPGLADVAAAPLAVRPDGKAVGLVAQALDEVEHGVARRQLERRPA